MKFDFSEDYLANLFCLGSHVTKKTRYKLAFQT